MAGPSRNGGRCDPFRGWLAALLLILTLLPALAHAQIYRWVDEAGTVHYTQSMDSIPERYRSETRPPAIDAAPSPPAEKRSSPSPSRPKAEQRLPPTSLLPPTRWETSDPLPEIVRIPFPRGSHILVDAKINGQGPVKLILDTGAGATGVASRALQKLGISGARYVCDSCETKGFGGTVKVDEVQVLSLQVGEVKLTMPVSVVNVDNFDSFGADGVLGRNFLDNFTVTIDPKQRALTLAPATLSRFRNRQPSTPSAQVARIPFSPDQDILVSARINGQGSVTLLLDTGFHRTGVTAQALQRLGISARNAETVTGRGAGGSFRFRLVPIAAVEVGEAKVGPLRIAAFDETDTLPKGVDGVLGLDFLNHFTVMIDPRERLVTLTAMTDPREQVSGVTPAPQGQRWWWVFGPVLVVLGVWALRVVLRSRQNAGV